jgi:hypothetical protein
MTRTLWIASLAVIPGALVLLGAQAALGQTGAFQTQTPFFFQQRPMWTPPGLNDYLAGRNNAPLPGSPMVPFSGRPMWSPPGLNDFLAGRNRFVFPQAAPFGRPLFVPPGVRALMEGRNRVILPPPPDFGVPVIPFRGPQPSWLQPDVPPPGSPADMWWWGW